MSWTRFVRRRHWDEERARELEDYLAREIDDNVARGLSLDAATRAAHRKLGNVTRIREEIYDMNTLHLVETVWQDLRYGGRLLLKNPTFSIVALLTLALGTGANAAIFQLVNSIRFRPLPVERPHELLSVGVDTHGKGRIGRAMGRRPYFSEPLWRSLRAEQQAFSELFAWGSTQWNVATDGEYRPVRGLYVSGSYFSGLGVGAHHGRMLTEADDRTGCGAAGAVLAHGFWQAHYGANPAVLGQTITLDGRPFEIVGVTPPPFFGTEVGRSFDVAVPLCAEPTIRRGLSGFGRPDVSFLDIMGRLKPGWTADRARAHLATLSAGIFASTLPTVYTAEAARDYAAFTFTAKAARTGVSGVRAAYDTQLWILLGATGLVLLVTCANLANLLLARATARRREIAVRLALGASRARIVRQMLSESVILAALGAAGGLLLAQWFSHYLVAALSTQSSRVFLDLSADSRVLAFTVCVAAIACLLFGLSPALQATPIDPATAMQAGGRSTTDSRERFAVRRLLVVAQVALSLVLVIGALLFGRSLRNLVTVDPGFTPEGILAVSVDIRRSSVEPAARLATYANAIERIRAVPGVEHAAEAFIVPMSGSGWNEKVLVEGETKEEFANFNRVGADYFKVMGTRLIAGRTFGPEDRLHGIETAIVNESFARTFLGRANPIGRRFRIETPPGAPQRTFHVIGLAADTKYLELREDFTPIAYLHAAQEAEVGPFLDLVLRSRLPAESLTPALTRAVRDVAPGATVAYESIQTYVRDSRVTERLMAALSGFFGVLALSIASIGLYGVMSYMVSRRKVEIGVRIALGADPPAVARMVLREAIVLLASGVAIGVLLAALTNRWVSTLLYGVRPWDPASFALAAGSLAAVGLLAAWLPARRAARLAPTIALRED